MSAPDDAEASAADRREDLVRIEAGLREAAAGIADIASLLGIGHGCEFG